MICVGYAISEGLGYRVVAGNIGHQVVLRRLLDFRFRGKEIFPI